MKSQSAVIATSFISGAIFGASTFYLASSFLKRRKEKKRAPEKTKQIQTQCHFFILPDCKNWEIRDVCGADVLTEDEISRFMCTGEHGFIYITDSLASVQTIVKNTGLLHYEIHEVKDLFTEVVEVKYPLDGFTQHHTYKVLNTTKNLLESKDIVVAFFVKPKMCQEEVLPTVEF